MPFSNLFKCNLRYIVYNKQIACSRTMAMHSEFVHIKFSKWERQKCLSMFQSLDEDDSGTLDPKEMIRAMRKLGLTSYTLQDAEETIAKFDVNRKGKINFNEFVEMLEAQTRDELYRKCTSKMFDAIEKDYNGRIKKSALRAVFIESKKYYADGKIDYAVENFIEDADKDENGRLDIDEFRTIVNTLPRDFVEKLWKELVQSNKF